MLVTIAVIVAVFAGAELLARKLGSYEQFRRDVTSGLYVASDSVGHILKPNFSGEIAKAFVTINRAGYRGEILDAATPSTRILMLGDSITFGYGLNDDQTISHFLEEDFDGFDAINFGVPGYHLGQSLALLKGRGLRLKPDWVVLNVCLHNDIDDSAAPHLSIGDIDDAADKIAEIATKDIAANNVEHSFELTLEQVFFWLSKYSALFFVARNAINLAWTGDTDPEAVLDEGEIKNSINVAVSLIEQMEEILRRNDIRFLLFLYPYLDGPSMWGKKRPSGKVEQQLLVSLRPTGLRAVSMYKEFEKRGFGKASISELFLDDQVHLSPRGSRLAAQIIHDHIISGTNRTNSKRVPTQENRR